MPVLGGYRDGQRSLAYPLAGSTDPGGLVIAYRGLWSVEFAHVLTVAGADLLARLSSPTPSEPSRKNFRTARTCRRRDRERMSGARSDRRQTPPLLH